MSYLGKEIQYTSFLQDTFSGDGVTTQFTLTESPGSSSGLIVNIGGVLQEPEYAYTVSGTTITFSEAVPVGTNNVNVVHLGVTVEINTPAANSIGLDELAASVTTFVNDSFTGDGVLNTFTLSKTAASASSLIVSIDGALQKPITAYNVSGTSLIFTEIPADTTVISVIHLGITYYTGTPSAGSVGTTELADNAVTLAKTSGSLITSGTAVATTSGTLHDFTGIPSWVKRVTILFRGVAITASNLTVQMGSGSIQTTGYISTGNTYNQANATSGASSTTGFITALSTGTTFSGSMTIELLDSNEWVSVHNGKLSTTNVISGGGEVTLSGALDQIRITTVSGTDTFSAGKINILYE